MDKNGLYPQRPVVSGCETATEKISWLFDRILHRYVDLVPAHLDSEDSFIKILDQYSSKVTENDILFSLDVVSLYPSIPIQESIEVILELCKTNKEIIKSFGIELHEVKKGLEIILNNNYIRFGDVIYRQKEGVAMGNRIAPVVAILFMNSIETSGITTAFMKPLIFKRYIDDCFGIWKGNYESLDRFLSHMNTLHPKIKFTMETDQTTGWLDFLRFRLKSRNGSIERKVFRKSTAKPIFLHATSHHSEQTKKNVIINQFKSIDKICNTEPNYKECADEFKTILLENGYEETYINELEKKARSLNAYLNLLFVNNTECALIPIEMNAFFKDRCVRIDRSPGDGHCLLHSICTLTSLTLHQLKTLIVNEFERDIETYSIGIIPTSEARKQLNEYLVHKNYRLDIVDNIPQIVSNCLARVIYIFEGSHSTTKVNRVVPLNNLNTPLLLKMNNEHYDALKCKSVEKNPLKKVSFDKKVILKLPYISEEHCRNIRHLLNNSNFNVIPIFTPGTTLINTLTSSALRSNVCNKKACVFKNKNCMDKNCIYKLQCTICFQEYIGETGRPFHERLKEHLKSIILMDNKSAMSEHYVKHHVEIPEEPFSYNILKKINNTTERKIAESIFIKQQQPAINRDSGFLC